MTGAAGVDLESELEAEIAAARHVVPHLGVHIVELESGRQVAAHEPSRPRIPASNQKLLTTAAVLHHLGPGYLFETPFVMRGEVVDGRLRGDLGVAGRGDPNISGRLHEGDGTREFRRWAAALRGRGVRRVEGDLYLSHGFFDDRLLHPDWPRDQLHRWYEAPVEALSFRDNTFLTRVWGARRAGEPAVVDVVPEIPLLNVSNGVMTSSSQRRHFVRIGRPAAKEGVVVTGFFYSEASPIDVPVAVRDPVIYFGTVLRRVLNENGVWFDGELRPVERLPGRWTLLSTHESDLLTTIEVTNKRSQNFYAESLFKLLGAELCGDGSWEGGRRVVEAFAVDHLGWDPETFVVADGSGMSRENRLSPRQLTTLLRRMHEHRWSREFKRSLAYSGEDGGSLHERLDEPPYVGNVAAKTGTLSGVSTLSGYVKARSGTLYAFSILGNGGAVWRGRRVQDDILEALVDHG